MTAGKRLFDFSVAIFLLVLFLPVLAVLGCWMLMTQGRPVFYVSERMRAPGQVFRLIKLRTMESVAEPNNTGVSGGDKSVRITPAGRFLRRARLDEVPQLLNVIAGDMSFVGPRPPLRVYVEDYPELYRRVLACRPGITGLATLVFHAHEERLLARCTTPAQTDALYRRRCIPRKARLDLIYRKNRSIALDLWILTKTAQKLVRGTRKRGN
ncbi:MAG: sugar transferase [Paracoccaceae bacterium]